MVPNAKVRAKMQFMVRSDAHTRIRPNFATLFNPILTFNSLGLALGLVHRRVKFGFGAIGAVPFPRRAFCFQESSCGVLPF
jgi:hypothetical protein